MRYVIAGILLIFGSNATPQYFRLGGVYDEISQTNAVDFVAPGSTWQLQDVLTNIGSVFSNGFGGVWQCEQLGGRGINFLYGSSLWWLQSKELILLYDGTLYGSGTDQYRQSISYGGMFATELPMRLRLVEIRNGLPGEKLVGVGFTVLSYATHHYGAITGRVFFTDGTSAEASREINEDGGQGDTFFGFKAPAGLGISSVELTGTNRVPFSFVFYDDLVFLTEAPIRVKIVSSGDFQSGNLQLMFNLLSQHDHVVEFAEQLHADIPWTALPDPPHNSGVLMVTNSSSQLFYRVRATPR